MTEAIAEVKETTPEEDALAVEYWKKYPHHYAPDTMNVPVLEPIQEDVFEEMFQHRKYALSSHHAFGKDLLGAMVSLTLTGLNQDECEGYIFAPTFAQVRDIHFKELHKIMDNTNIDKKVIPGKITESPLMYKIAAACFVVGKSPKQAAKGAATPQVIAGQHSIVVFVIITEANALTKQVKEQIEGITNTGGEVHIILLLNPLNKNSEVGRIFHNKKARVGWFTREIKAYEAPNMVINGFTSLEAIREEAHKIENLPLEKQEDYFNNKKYKMKNKHLLSPGWVIEKYISWGESPLFRSKVLGEWVEDSENAWVSLERMEELMMGRIQGVWGSEEAQYAKWNENRIIGVGIDCAREGSDDTVVSSFEGNREFKPSHTFDKTYKDTSKGRKFVEDSHFCGQWVIDTYITPHADRIMTIVIDMTGGYGIGVYDYLTNHKSIKNSKFVSVVGVKFNGVSNVMARGLKNKQGKPLSLYPEMATQMIAQMSDQINSDDGMLLFDDDDFKNEITNRKKELDNELRDKIEPKEDYKQRNGKSPDKMDSKMLAWHGVIKKTKKKATRAIAQEVASKRKGNSAGTMAGSINSEDNY